jgi:copper chaperone CopZ
MRDKSMSSKVNADVTITIPVFGMSCGGCAGSVQRALEKHPGVHAAAVNLAQHNATVEFDSAATSAGSVVETIRAAGYGAALPDESASQRN